MYYITGQTVYHVIPSLDGQNNPITGASFSNVLFRNGEEYTGTTVSMTLVNSSQALYRAEFDVIEDGEYQLVSRNTTTDGVFVGDLLNVDNVFSGSSTIYVGL